MPKYHGYLIYSQQYDIEADNDRVAMDKLENISIDLDSYNFIHGAHEEKRIAQIHED